MSIFIDVGKNYWVSQNATMTISVLIFATLKQLTVKRDNAQNSIQLYVYINASTVI